MMDYVPDEESIAYQYRGAEYIQTFNCLWGKRTEFFHEVICRRSSNFRTRTSA